MKTAYNTEKIVKIEMFEEHGVYERYTRYMPYHWLWNRSGPNIRMGLDNYKINLFIEEYGDVYEVRNERIIKKALIRATFVNGSRYEERFDTDEEALRRFKQLRREYKLKEEL